MLLHLQLIFNRILGFARAQYQFEENLSHVRFGILFSFLAILIGLDFFVPMRDYITAPRRFAAANLFEIEEFRIALVSTLARCGLVFVAVTAAVAMGVASLTRLFRLTTAQAKDRVFALIGWGKIPELGIENAEFGKDYNQSPIKRVGGPGTLHIASNTALVIERAGVFSRVLGPGRRRLEPFEKIFDLVDLRPQNSQKSVTTQTRDGIPVKVESNIEFHIIRANIAPQNTLSWVRLIARAALELWALWYRWRGQVARAQAIIHSIPQRIPFVPHPLQAKPPYPYNDSDILKAAYSVSMPCSSGSEPTPTKWFDIVPNIPAGALKGEISALSFDRLCEPEDASPDQLLDLNQTPRAMIQLAVENTGRNRAGLFGCSMSHFSFKHVLLDSNQLDKKTIDEVEELQKDAWRAEWMRRALRIYGAAQGETKRLVESVRAEAQRQMLREILAALPAGANRRRLRRIVVLRTIEYLEQIALDPQARRYFPDEAIESLRKLRRSLR